MSELLDKTGVTWTVQQLQLGRVSLCSSAASARIGNLSLAIANPLLIERHDRAGVGPQEIDILVTNCSIYCPTPSLASMLVNRFKLRQDVQTYHLGGMGCGNGVMALSLIRDLLQVRQRQCA